MSSLQLSKIDHRTVYIGEVSGNSESFVCFFNHEPVQITRSQLDELRQNVKVMTVGDSDSDFKQQLQQMSAQAWDGWEYLFNKDKENRATRITDMNLVKCWDRFGDIASNDFIRFHAEYKGEIEERIKSLDNESIEEKAEGLVDLLGQSPDRIKVQLENGPVKPDLNGARLPLAARHFLTWIKENIQKLKELKIYEPSKIRLTAFPGLLCQYLPNLQHLVLSCNQLVTLPEEIGNLRELRILNLRDNSIGHLPASVGQLDKLWHLNLAQNSSCIVPLNIERIPHLTQLLLGGSFTKVPDRFYEMRSIEQIDIWTTSKIQVDWKKFIQLSKLTRLSILPGTNQPDFNLEEKMERLKEVELSLGE